MRTLTHNTPPFSHQGCVFSRIGPEQDMIDLECVKQGHDEYIELQNMNEGSSVCETACRLSDICESA